MVGFKGVPIAVIMKFVWNEMLEDDILTRANSMAFSFFISIFPALLVVLSLLPYFPMESMIMTLQKSYVNLLPKEMANYIDNIIYEMTQTGKESILGLSLILAFYFASSGVSTMIKGFHKSYEITYKKQNLLQRQWRALKLTGLLGLLLLGTLLVTVLGRPFLLKWLGKAGIVETNYAVYNYLRWLSVFIFYYIGIAVIYRFGPAFKTKLKLITPGATLATILSVISSIGYAVYVENFANYNEVYGSIGALILIMVWLQINSFIILLGYELNASIAINRDILTRKSS